MISTPPTASLPLQNIDADGQVPRRRLRYALDAQSIASSLWENARDRVTEYAAILGQIQGNPPYSPTKLKAAGRGSDANFNTLEAEALVDAACVPYYDLFCGGNRLVDLHLDTLDGADWQSAYASGLVASEYDRLLRRWPAFEHVMNTLIHDYVTWGRAHAIWRSLGNWRFKRIPHYKVLVPPATDIDDDEEHELVCIRQTWTVARLYGMIRNRSHAEAAGWNVDEVLMAIGAAISTDPQTFDDAMAVQEQLKEADISVSTRSQVVATATILVREFNGKWSECIVRTDVNAASPDGTPTEPRFLFRAENRYDCLEEAMISFFFKSGDGSWNGASGYGRGIFPIMQLKDRIACSQADSVFLRNSLVLQATTELDRSRMNLLQLGKLTIVPSGLQVQQSAILGDIASTIEVSRELSMMVDRNTGIYRPTLEKQKGNPDTLGEYQMKFAQATVLSTASINRFYSQLDRLYEEQWDRVLEAGGKGTFRDDAPATDWENEARRFIDRCKQRGVRMDQLKKLDYIRAYRAIGNGSAALRQQNVQLAVGALPLFPADGQENIVEDFARSLGGQAAVDRWMPRNSRAKLPSDHTWVAMSENADMHQGAPVTWTPSQNNLLHLQEHLKAGAQAAQSLQQGAPPADVLMFIEAVGAHAAVHIQRESSNPTSKKALDVFDEQLKQLGKVADKLRSQLEQQAKQQAERQQQAQEQVTDQQLKLMEIQGKLQQSQAKMEGTMALKKERQDAELALKQQQQQADLAMSDADTAASIVQQTAKTQSDIAAQQAKTAAQVEAAKVKAAAKPAGGSEKT